MDCHQVRLLLAFQRQVEATDATERHALQQHLDACPDCAAVAHAEQAADRVLAAAMRDVPVPAQGKERLLARFAEARRPRRWPILAASAAAALVLLTLGVTGYLYFQPRTIDLVAFAHEVDSRARTPQEQVEEWFADAGLSMKYPAQFDYRRLLTYDVVEFQGQRVPKLVFFHAGSNPAVAQILVLDPGRFQLAQESDRPIEEIPPVPTTTYHVRPMQGEEHLYLVYYTGETLDPFLRQDAH